MLTCCQASHTESSAPDSQCCAGSCQSRLAAKVSKAAAILVSLQPCTPAPGQLFHASSGSRSKTELSSETRFELPSPCSDSIAVMQQQGIPVLTVNTKREHGRKAQSGNIAAGKVSMHGPSCPFSDHTSSDVPLFRRPESAEWARPHFAWQPSSAMLPCCCCRRSRTSSVQRLGRARCSRCSLTPVEVLDPTLHAWTCHLLLLQCCRTYEVAAAQASSSRTMAMPSCARSMCHILLRRSAHSSLCSGTATLRRVLLSISVTEWLGGSAVQSIIELSRTQDEEVGDGTTSVIILGPLCTWHARSEGV